MDVVPLLVLLIAGEKLTCDYYGKEQDYTKKSGVEFTNICT
jgi:hypothetical protein